jgi:hypothetical protein
MFTNEELEEFRQIYREEFGEELSPDATLDMALRVAAIYKLLLQKPPEQTKKPK